MGMPHVIVGGLGGNDDSKEWRQTRRVVKSLPPRERAEVARMFIGWVCDVELDAYGLGEPETKILAVEGVAQDQAGALTHRLVCTSTPNMHDLSRMETYSLATVRSITTRRRF